MRKLLALVTIAALLVITIPGIVDSYAERQHPQMPERYTLHTVQAGETLWGISERYMPSVDNRQGVRLIRENNGMPRDYILQPGDELNVPDPQGAMDKPWGQD